MVLQDFYKINAPVDQWGEPSGLGGGVSRDDLPADVDDLLEAAPDYFDAVEYDGLFSTNLPPTTVERQRMAEAAESLVNRIINKRHPLRRLPAPNKLGMVLEPGGKPSLDARRLTAVGLEKKLREIVETVKTCRDTVEPFCVVSALVCVAATAGKRYCVRVGDFANYAQLYALIVGKPSTGKGNALEWFKKPLKAKGEEAQRVYRENLNAWKDGGCKGDKPVLRRAQLSDFSDEVILTRAMFNHDTLFFIDGEGAKIFKCIGRYTKSTVTVEHLISFYDNTEINRDRVDDEKCFRLECPCMAIGAGYQPSRVKALQRDGELLTSGLAARFLFSYEERDGRGEKMAVPTHYVNQWCALLNEIETGGDVCCPAEVPMAPMASAIYDAACTVWHGKYDNHEDDRLVELHSKLDINVVRWALCVALANSHGEITADDMLYSVACMEYFRERAEVLLIDEANRPYVEPKTAIAQADELNRWRDKRGLPPLTQKEMAVALGVTPSALCQAEAKERHRTADGAAGGNEANGTTN